MSCELSMSQSGSPAHPPGHSGSVFPGTHIEGADHAMDGAESDVIHVNCNILTDEQLNLLLSHVAHRAPHVRPSPTLTPASPFIMPPFPAMQAGQPLQLDKPIPTLFPSVSPETIFEIIHFEFFPADLYKLDPTSLEKGLDTVIIATQDHYPHLASLIVPLHVYFRILGCYAASSNSPDAVVAILNASLAYCAHLSSLNLTYKWPALLQYHNQFFFRRSREMARGKFSGWLAPDNELIAEVLFGHNLSQRQDRPPYTLHFLLVVCCLHVFAVVAVAKIWL